jgi:hypothetical protein
MMATTATLARFMMVVLPLAGFTPLRAQEFKSPIWGGSGGTSSYNLDCGSSGVMVGIYGKTGLWIDQLGIICRAVKADGTLGSSFTRGPSGGSGGTSGTAQCESGKVVGHFYVHAGSYINMASVGCYPWLPNTRRPDYSKNYYGQAIGSTNYLLSEASTRCPVEKVGKALRGKYGIYIDSLQFVCDAYNQ